MHDANEPASQGSELRTFQAEVDDAGAEALGQTRGPSRPQRPENQPRVASGRRTSPGWPAAGNSRRGPRGSPAGPRGAWQGAWLSFKEVARRFKERSAGLMGTARPRPHCCTGHALWRRGQEWGWGSHRSHPSKRSGGLGRERDPRGRKKQAG